MERSWGYRNKDPGNGAGIRVPRILLLDPAAGDAIEAGSRHECLASLGQPTEGPGRASPVPENHWKKKYVVEEIFKKKFFF